MELIRVGNEGKIVKTIRRIKKNIEIDRRRIDERVRIKVKKKNEIVTIGTWEVIIRNGVGIKEKNVRND